MEGILGQMSTQSSVMLLSFVGIISVPIPNIILQVLWVHNVEFQTALIECKSPLMDI